MFLLLGNPNKRRFEIMNIFKEFDGREFVLQKREIELDALERKIIEKQDDIDKQTLMLAERIQNGDLEQQKRIQYLEQCLRDMERSFVTKEQMINKREVAVTKREQLLKDKNLTIIGFKKKFMTTFIKMGKSPSEVQSGTKWAMDILLK